MEESTIYQEILARGKAIGLDEGRLAEAQKMVLVVGSQKFSSADSAIQAAVQAITDSQHLEQMAKRVFEAETWAELLKPSRPSTRRRRQPPSRS